MKDGISEFVNNFLYDGKIPLSWVMYWSEGGREPLNTAWLASNNPTKMLVFLLMYDTESYEKARNASFYYRLKHFQRFENFTSEADCIRLEVPTIITLSSLLERLKM